MTERNELVRLLAEHRMNAVTEQVGNPDNPGGPLVLRTRVKCDGHGCDFYAEGPRYWEVVKQHDNHLADVLAYHGWQRLPDIETIQWEFGSRGKVAVVQHMDRRDAEEVCEQLHGELVRRRAYYGPWEPVSGVADV